MKKQFKYRYIITVLLTLVLAGCSTQKNTFVNRNYHNLTAHYNVYFNGNEAMKRGLLKVETRVEEDYTKTLPVFKESIPGTESMISGDMTTAIEKGEKLIKLHSITKPPKSQKNKSAKKRAIKKEDYNKWVDDAYMMIGKGYFYKKDFIMASNTFTHIIRKFKNEPVKYDAYLWLIRTYSESERYTEARELVESLSGDNLFPKELEGELAINAADLHLKQQHLDEAIQYLNIGIKKIKGNKRKTRYNFILAQLYQETGKNEQALEAYHQVIRRRPDYTMLFNARINSASVYSGKGNVAELRKELIKMSKKVRNQNFLDQIYYALGNISYNEGKTDDAIGLYKKSASFSVSNTYQRALSCLTLGDIYFDKKFYIPSGNYYDSAMAVIDEHYPNYKTIAEKYNSLNSLVTNLQTVVTQDSLQALAKMSPAELNARVEGWIQQANKRLTDQQSSSSGGDEYASSYNYATSNRMRLGNTGSGWYFYNPSTISYGKKEFQRLWGDRKNEDNWRRKNKSISMGDDAEDNQQANDLASDIAAEEKERADDPTKSEYYTQDIPNNDSLMAVSHNKIRDALYTSATLLKTEFNDFENSVKYFKELEKRYPGNIYALNADFNMWDLYTTLAKPDSSSFYRNKILTNHPQSNYAKYLINPNFFLEEQARKDSINSVYASAFNAYKVNDFNRAAVLINNVMAMKPDSALMPKVEFIKTVAESRFLEKQKFSGALQAYIAKYPSAEPTQLAKDIIGLLKDDKLNNYTEMVNTGYLNEVIKNMELISKGSTTGTEEERSKWDIDSDLLHYFVIAIPNDEDIDVNRLKYDIANYNIDHYTSLDFEIETEKLNEEIKLIVVRNFEDKESALVYFLSIIRKQLVFKTLAGKQFLNFIISNNNFRQMLNDRSYNDYLPFFVKNYSNKTKIDINDADLDSPEQLLARLKQDENERFVEKGEFVEVKTANENYKAPEPKEQVFDQNYVDPHSFMILINQPRFKTGFLMRDFVQYNNAEYRQERLKVVPTNFKEATALLVSTFKNGVDALEYMKKAEAKKELFKALDTTAYICYVISDENLKRLRDKNNFDEWERYYQANYVRRKPPVPVKPVEEKKAESTAVTTQKPIKEEPKKVEVPTTVKEEKVTELVTPEKTAEEQKTVEVKAPEVKAPEKVEAKVEDKTPTAYSGPFVEAPDAEHLLVYVLPSSGSNKTLLSTYIVRFNAMNYRSAGLNSVVEDFNEYQSLVVIGTFENSVKAKEYAAGVNTDSRIVLSLRNVNYRSYLITKENLEILKKSKNLQDYQRFYESKY